MCCETHDLRSFVLKYRGEQEHLAPADDRRCRCTELGKWGGQACVMEADGEDLLCAWCRSTDHMAWYDGMLRGGDPAVAAYYADRRRAGYAEAYPGGQLPEWQPARWEAASPMAELRDEAVRWSQAELERGIREGLAGDAYGNGYPASGPGGELTDYQVRPEGVSPFSFTPGEVRWMQSQVQLPPSSEVFEFEGMTVGDVMRYLRNKYGA